MLRELYYLFLPYRSYAYPFLVLSAIAISCWLAFRLYRRRTLRPRPSLLHEFLLLTLVVYLVGLAVATLTPNRSSSLRAEGRGGIELRPNLASLTCSSASFRGSARGFCQHNARANAVLFFPLGLLLPLIWRRLRFGRGLAIAIALSFSIELVQYLSSAWGSYRAADVNDFILNVLGALIGLTIGFLLRLAQRNRPEMAPA